LSRRTFRFRGESLILNAEARAAAPGKFVELPDGITHYELAGPDDGQAVVLVHGFSTPCFIWDPTFNPLAEAGFRVLRYDLFGRGYSDRPDTVYDLDLFNRQLLDLLPALNLTLPIDLIGLSMGGAISVGFTDRQPAMVRKLGLVDPAGFPLKAPFAARFLFASGLGEWIMSLMGDKILLTSMQEDVYQTEIPPEWVKLYRTQMQYKGFKRAILSTVRHGPLSNMADAYARVGKQEREVLLIWGRHDQTVPFEINEKARQAIPHAEFHAIDEAGHLPHLEHPDIVNPLLIEFLRK
jgi:pimeloyl-ACP methyl ester carboxylesterase